MGPLCVLRLEQNAFLPLNNSQQQQGAGVKNKMRKGKKLNLACFDLEFEVDQMIFIGNIFKEIVLQY